MPFQELDPPNVARVFSALETVWDEFKTFIPVHGRPTQLRFEVDEVREASANPPSSRQGTDRPGRIQNAVSPTSATEETDWHELADAKFARDTAAALRRPNQSGLPQDIVLVAPPRILAALRQYLDGESRSRILAEVDKDLTKHPIHEIERLLSSPWGSAYLKCVRGGCMAVPANHAPGSLAIGGTHSCPMQAIGTCRRRCAVICPSMRRTSIERPSTTALLRMPPMSIARKSLTASPGQR